MILDGTGSVYDDTGWYLVSIGWYCLVLSGTGSAKQPNSFVWSLFFGPKPNLSGSSSSSYETFQIVETISSSPAWVRRLTRVKASHHACIVCKQVIIIITYITTSIIMGKGQKSLGYPALPTPKTCLQNVRRSCFCRENASSQ